LSGAAERRRLERELKLRIETWQREFATRYAEASATNRALAEAIQQQFAGAFLYIRDPDREVSDRRFIPTGAKLTIGRGPGCDLVLPDPQRSMSKSHAVIEMVAGEIWVTDLHATNGTFVDGKLVTSRTRVRDGSTLTFGKVEALLKVL
jgi:pSer/pThr/pTyr-binding forkhead associated (FHA) protein